MAIYFDKHEDARAIDEAFRSGLLGQDQSRLAVWDAGRELDKLQAGKGGSLAVMMERLKQHPDSATLQLLVRNALAHFNDHAGAAKSARAAVEVAKNSGQLSRAVRLALAEGEAAKEDVSAEAVRFAALLRKMAQAAPDDEVPDLLLAMQDVSRSLGLGQISLAVLERRVGLNPADVSLRFDLAYKYSEDNRVQSAFARYSAIPSAQRSGTAWNNLGVAFTNLQMPGRSIAAYNRASELGETIADSNLADRLAAGGFFTEAQTRIEEAMKASNYHANLVASLDAIRQKRVAEGQAETENLEKAQPSLRYMATVGAAALDYDQPELRANWNIGECTIRVTSDDGVNFRGVGEYEAPASGSGGGLGNALVIRTSPRITRVTVTFRRLGNALEGEIESLGVGEAVSLLGRMMTTRNLLMRVVPGGQRIQVWEKDHEAAGEDWVRVMPAALPVE